MFMNPFLFQLAYSDSKDVLGVAVLLVAKTSSMWTAISKRLNLVNGCHLIDNVLFFKFYFSLNSIMLIRIDHVFIRNSVSFFSAMCVLLFRLQM